MSLEDESANAKLAQYGNRIIELHQIIDRLHVDANDLRDQIEVYEELQEDYKNQLFEASNRISELEDQLNRSIE